MKKIILALLFLSAITVTGVFAQNVSSASEFNGIIGSVVDGSTITFSETFVADNDFSGIDSLDVTINNAGAGDILVSGLDEFKGFYITNSNLSINNINLSGFRNEISSSISEGSAIIDNFGGALYAYNSIIEYTGNNIAFENNIASASIVNTGSGDGKAYTYGGAIYAEYDSTFSFLNSGNINFSGNSTYGESSGPGNTFSWGGAIYSRDSSFFFDSFGDIFFSNNSAYSDGNADSYGGAIYSRNSVFHFISSSGSVNFVNNSAHGYGERYGFGYGGAIYNESYSDFLFAGSGDINFTSNTAYGYGENEGYGESSGGAVAATRGDFLFVSSGDINFVYNKAHSYGYDYSYSEGGAIFGSFCTFSFDSSGSINFLNNESHGYASREDYGFGSYGLGGAIFSWQYIPFYFDSFGDINFSSNTAHGYGGFSAIGAGGAIYDGYNSYFYFASSGNINFVNNSALGYGFNEGHAKGGAIASDRSSTFSFVNSGDINFLNNTVSGESYGDGAGIGTGGAIDILSSYDSSLLLFLSSGNINFIDNVASGEGFSYGESKGGAINVASYYGLSSFLLFVSSGDIKFLNNMTSGKGNGDGYGESSGGAIYSQSSSFSFISSYGSINFADNRADSEGNGFYGRSYGGAIYSKDDSYFSFDSYSDIIFVNNTANGVGAAGYGFGGAIYANYSTFSFVSSGNINFSSNTASGDGFLSGGGGEGGAIYGGYGSYFFFDSFGDINFLNNTAYGSGSYGSGTGGAIDTMYDSYFSFVSSGNINFSSNTANGAGGAVYSNRSTYFFDNSGNINFLNNIGNNYGGAIYAYDSVHSFISSGDISFLNNTLNGNNYSEGGAVYYEDSEVLFVSSGNINFLGNTSNSSGASGIGNGGAVFSYCSVYSFFSAGEINFSNNKATGTDSGHGGAVYSYGDIFDFTADTMKFENNAAGSLGGAFYITDGSTVSFNALNSDLTILFKNNRHANGELNDVYLNFGYGAPAALNFNAGADSVILINGIKVDGDGSGSVNKFGTGNFIFGGNTIIKNAAFNIESGDVRFLDNANFTGTSMVLPAGNILDMQNNTVNIIIADVFVSTTNTRIDIWANGDHDQIISGEATVGGSLDIKARVGNYNNSEYTIIVSSLANVQGIFTSTSASLPLQFTFNDYANSNAVILTLDGTYGSDFSSRTFTRRGRNHVNTARILDDISTDTSGDMADIITELMTRSDREIEETLLSMSGYFLPNVIRSAAGASANEIYDKIREDRTNNGLWAQVRGEMAKFGENDNSPEDYKDNSLGLMIGFDKYMSDNCLMWGVYGRFNSHSIEQGQNKADGTNKGLGVYGGYIKEEWELKTMISGSFDNFNTERYVYTPLGNRTAKGEIDAFTVGGDIEAALKYEASDIVKVRHYVGIEIENVNYKGFKESGAGAVNLDVKGGNYIRSAARVGAGAEYAIKEWSVYARGEAKYLMTGFEPEIESVFEGTNSSFTTKGAEEGRMQAGFGFGGEMFINQNWKLFANANFYVAQKYGNVYGNLGVRYIFGK
ncbi:MAG: autotransporter domain-containing protein [Endomicrobia bacterium]|nr:autotransporter domain-containing protein [Endomicrobiia bacterium]MCL2507424.1 autotransporter domain-containing protein [Endomicrobiia bacterium]